MCVTLESLLLQEANGNDHQAEMKEASDSMVLIWMLIAWMASYRYCHSITGIVVVLYHLIW